MDSFQVPIAPESNHKGGSIPLFLFAEKKSKIFLEMFWILINLLDIYIIKQTQTHKTMTTSIEKVRQELSKVFAMEDALQKEVWTKENFEANSAKEDMLSAWANSLQAILNELESNLEDSEFTSLNER